MELLQLRYFLTAAEYQHITKAAEHLQIAQPALSQAIHRLEAELGVPLFERKSRSIELNDAGRFLQKRLIPIISSLDQLAAELQMGREQAIHTIRLRLLSASALITNRIIAFRSLRPDVNSSCIRLLISLMTMISVFPPDGQIFLRPQANSPL